MLNTKEFPEKAGRIFPPIVKIEYGEVTIKDLEAGAKMDFEFSVTYKMEMREARKDIEVNDIQFGTLFEACRQNRFANVF